MAQFAWISRHSGDGIVLVERLDGAAWVEAMYGTFCGGVGVADMAYLIKAGVPEALAGSWGWGTERCDDAAGRSLVPRAAAAS